MDIVNDPVFKVSNRVFSAMLVKLKDEGLERVHHKDPLAKQDLVKLYNSYWSVDLDTPAGLQDKVFIDFMMYFCNRGRENLREIKIQTFWWMKPRNFIELYDKNHKGDIDDSTSQGGRIYRTGTIMCLYSSFKKYLSVLNNDAICSFKDQNHNCQKILLLGLMPLLLGKTLLATRWKPFR